MKTMTCREVGGACDVTFRGETFEDIAQQSQAHGMEMLAKKDPAHLQAMEKMRQLMQDPPAMQAWYDARKAEFEQLPES